MTVFATPAYAAENSGKKSFFNELFAPIISIFSHTTSAQSSESATEELGPARVKLLKFLDKKEMAVRVSIPGRDIYLKREVILSKLSAVNDQIRESSVSGEVKDAVSVKFSKIEKILNLDLTESPQDKIKPVVLDTFDGLETFVFSISESDASKILAILESQEINK